MDATYDIGDTILLTGIFLLRPTRGEIDAGSVTLDVADATGYSQSDSILVEGAGPLGADLVTTIQTIVGTTFTLAAAAGSSVSGANVGKPTATTSTFKVRKPDGTTATVTTSSPATGRYEGTFSPTLAGEHWYSIAGTVTVVTVEERRFFVRERRVT